MRPASTMKGGPGRVFLGSLLGETSPGAYAHPALRVVVLGGPPFGESIVMWWNFAGRTHEEIVASRVEWQTQVAEATTGQDVRPGRFGVVVDKPLVPIPAPALPNARLKQRR